MQTQPVPHEMPPLSQGESTPGALGGSVALSHRTAWKRHQYLQARFEYHLKARRGLNEARRLANQDLVAKFGPSAGYSAQELEDILLDDSQV